MVRLKPFALLVLCVLGLQMISLAHAEVSDGMNSELPLLLRPNMRIDPGAMIVVGRDADQQDLVATALSRLGMQSWLNDSTTRLPFVRPDLKINFAAVNQMTLQSLKVTNVDLENTRALNQGFFLVSVGGPDSNITTRKMNMELPIQFIKDHQKNMWTITNNATVVPDYYYGDEYGIIAFVPDQPVLNAETFEKITNGHKQIGSLIVAGNGREGTLAAAICLRTILNGSDLEGRKLLQELDKVLIWMASGEEQTLHPLVIIVKNTGEDTAEIVDIFLF
ncbi:MAG: hypothetical protein HXS47_07465 [Theionarchaea archaeon]|nr:hypothetical protein [Theionarchaea archaeon]